MVLKCIGFQSKRFQVETNREIRLQSTLFIHTILYLLYILIKLSVIGIYDYRYLYRFVRHGVIATAQTSSLIVYVYM